MAELEPMSTTDLPPDILFSNILPRLPPKSQSRFKCVSKQWHSFLTSPSFGKIHRRHVINNDRQCNQKLLLLPNNRPWEFRTIDCETPKHGFTASRRLPFKVKPGQEISILSSLHGMVCVGLSMPDTWSELSDLILWNPSTGEYKTLSRTDSHKDCYERYYGHQFGLYYCSSKDDYRLLCGVTSHPNINVYIYSLKSDSWRKIESTGGHSNVELHYSVPSVLLNEKVYFLVKYKGGGAAPKSYSLMTFDTQTEKLRDIATPNFGIQMTCLMGFMVVRDCIHLSCLVIRNNSIGDQRCMIELWRMDGDGDWSMVETCSWKEQLSSYDQPQHLMRNGNWLMYSRLKEGFYVVDTKKQTKEIVCCIGIAFHPQGKYIDNIASPNQYLNYTDDLDQEDVEDNPKEMEGRKYRWNVPGFKQFLGACKFLYSHLSNRT